MSLWKKFWYWYEKYYLLNIGLAALLFTLQLIHLYWLTAHVVAHRLLGQSFFELAGLWQTLIVLVDYTEIPALLTTNLVYLNELRKKINFKSILFLFFINSQFLHLFWITDEFVVEQLTQTVRETILPLWLAWLAIAIDYFELPVIFDTLKKFIVVLRQKRFNRLKKLF